MYMYNRYKHQLILTIFDSLIHKQFLSQLMQVLYTFLHVSLDPSPVYACAFSIDRLSLQTYIYLSVAQTSCHDLGITTVEATGENIGTLCLKAIGRVRCTCGFYSFGSNSSVNLRPVRC